MQWLARVPPGKEQNQDLRKALVAQAVESVSDGSDQQEQLLKQGTPRSS